MHEEKFEFVDFWDWGIPMFCYIVDGMIISKLPMEVGRYRKPANDEEDFEDLDPDLPHGLKLYHWSRYQIWIHWNSWSILEGSVPTGQTAWKTCKINTCLLRQAVVAKICEAQLHRWKPHIYTLCFSHTLTAMQNRVIYPDEQRARDMLKVSWTRSTKVVTFPVSWKMNHH